MGLSQGPEVSRLRKATGKVHPQVAKKSVGNRYPDGAERSKTHPVIKLCWTSETWSIWGATQ